MANNYTTDSNNSPCNGCEVRCEMCHGQCEQYASWKELMAEDASARHFGESKVAAYQRAYYESHKEQIMEAQRRRRAKKKGMEENA